MKDFNTLTLKQIFLKTKPFFRKLEYRFLVESTNIENALFPYKTALSEANVKINWTVSTKWTNHKKRIFASNYFIFFFKILLQFKNLLLIRCTNDPNTQIPTFYKYRSFNWQYFLHVSILKCQKSATKVSKTHIAVKT